MSIASLLVKITLASSGPDWEYTSKPRSQEKDWSHNGECGSGSNQSPINIDSKAFVNGPAQAKYAGTLDNWTTWYNLNSTDFTNTGHGLQANRAKGKWWSEFRDSATDTLFRGEQFHFHFPSEHTIEGKRYAGEMHLVSLNEAGTWAVVQGFLIDSINDFDATGADIDMFKALGFNSSLPEKGKTNKVGEIKLKEALQRSVRSGYYHYTGSLTTPPCSEIVSWFVHKEPLKMTAAMIENSKKAIGVDKSIRAVQDVNGRPIVLDNLQASDNDPIIADSSNKSDRNGETRHGLHAVVFGLSANAVLLAFSL